MSPLQIILISIISSFALILLFIFFIWLRVYYLQKKESQMLIKFCRLENNQAIKREKYINTITTKDAQLKSIVAFLKSSIQRHENQLKITKSNILGLRKIKSYSNFKEYKIQFKKVEKGITWLNHSIKEIDKYALDSKAFKESSLGLLIHIRRSFLQIETFYRFHLLPEKFYNNDLYDLIWIIKEYLRKINLSISAVNKDALVQDFEKVINFVIYFASWNLKAYINWLKLVKIEEIYEKAKEIKNKNNLHFSREELKSINAITRFIDENHAKALIELKKGKFQEIEKIVDEMLKNAFLFKNKIALTYEEQKLLNDVNLKKYINPQIKKTIHEFNQWAAQIIYNWRNQFNSVSHQLYDEATQLTKVIYDLNEHQKNLVIIQEDLPNKNNKEILNYNLNLVKLLNESNIKFNQLNENVFLTNNNYKKTVEKIWILKLYLSQLIDLAKTLILESDYSYKALTRLLNQTEKLSDKIINNFDNYDELLNEYEILDSEYQIYNKFLVNKLAEKNLALKLYNFWKTLAFKNKKYNENLNNIILENLKQKKWNDSLTLTKAKIQDLKVEEDQNNNTKQNFISKNFWKKNKAN